MLKRTVIFVRSTASAPCTLDFPWLYNYRLLWDVVVITLMTGGTVLAATALILE
jgi:hypothetical protein